MYVRVTTIAHALLMLLFRPAAHVWRLSALHGLGPLPTGFLAAPAPPWVYYQGSRHTERYVRWIQGPLRRPQPVDLSQARLDRVMAQERFPCVRAFYNYCTRFTHAWVPAHGPHTAALGLGPLPFLLTGFLDAPAPPWAYYQGPPHTERYVR